jgi:hypothetical protein
MPQSTLHSPFYRSKSQALCGENHMPLKPLALPLCAALLPLISVPQAVACSDLPNICGQATEHHRNMMDIAATPPWDDGSGYDEGPEYSESDWRDWSSTGPTPEAPAATALPIDNAAYQSYLSGDWFHKESPAGLPGEYCVATFMKEGVGAMVMGPGGGYPNAFLAFFSQDIPRPASLKKIKVTLKQTGEKPQTLNVFNARLPGVDGFGMIIFAVPSIDAAMQGMLDKHSFEVTLKNKSVAKIAWHDGNTARKKLRGCVAG